MQVNIYCVGGFISICESTWDSVSLPEPKVICGKRWLIKLNAGMLLSRQKLKSEFLVRLKLPNRSSDPIFYDVLLRLIFWYAKAVHLFL
jgi:hypothetical protein